MAQSALSSLRGRLLLLILMAVVPAVLIILHTGWKQRLQAREQARNTALQLAHLAADAQRRLIGETELLLSAVSQLPVVQRLGPACGATLARFLKLNSRYANFGVIGADGRLRCSALTFSGVVDLSDRAYFRRAMASRSFVVGEYQVGRLTKKGTINLAQPILGSDGRVQSVTFAAVDVAWLSQVARDAELPVGSTVAVIDDQGAILMRFPLQKELLGTVQSDSPLISALRSQPEGVAEVAGLDNIERIYAWTPILRSGNDRRTHLTVGIPSSMAYAAADAMLQRNFLVLLVVALLTMAVAWFGTEVAVLRHVRGLLNAVGRLAKGDLSARAPLDSSKNEIHQLAHAFNKMAEHLEHNAVEMNEHERRIMRLNRVYAVLSGINGAILRIRDRDALFAEACRIAVEEGRFRMAWIGLANEQSGALEPLAHAGHEHGYLESVVAGLQDSDAPAHRIYMGALTRGETVVCNALHDDPEFRRDTAARDRGYRACTVLPLRPAGRTVGIFCLFSIETDWFDTEEMKLLEELAADTSLGLEHIETASKLHYLAYFDVLTGLPNRSLFADRLAQIVARRKLRHGHAALIMLRVEQFKDINSVHGHHIGDLMIQEVATRLNRLVRDGDTVARTGSASFGLILAEVETAQDATQVAQAIINEFRQPLELGSKELYVTLRVGIALYPEDGEEAETLLKHCAAALHTSRDEPGASVRFYTPEIDSRAAERLNLEKELRHAVDRRELSVHFQPIVDLNSLRVIGCESLLRWDNPRLGSVPPTRFIPVAEETGLIIAIGEWALQVASAQSQLWHREGIPDHISVNVSTHQLRHHDFERSVEDLVHQPNGKRDRADITLEITESELMKSRDRAIALLSALRQGGMKVSIDDFGTGYSSLSYLMTLPVDILKIDLSFIRNMANGAEDASIVKAIIALGHSLNLQVIAEGVETLRQLTMLRALGCDAAQGNLFSDAVPADVYAHISRQQFTLPQM